MGTALSEMSAAVRVGQLAVAAVALCPDPGPLTEALDYLAVTSLGFASAQPDDAWAAVETSPVPTSVLECLEEIGRLISDWSGDVCDTHPDWSGFYSSFSTALAEARRRNAA